MRKIFIVAVISALVCLSIFGNVAAADDSINEDDHIPGHFFPSTCKATIGSKIYPGYPVESVIACRNGGEKYENQTAVIVSGFLQPLNTFNMILQNFSFVRHGRSIVGGETVTFLYEFIPSSYLEPGDYNLVLGVYFQASETNETFYMPAYNSTITLEASNSDPRTIMTYITLLAILCGIVYGVAAHLGVSSPLKKQPIRKSSPDSPKSTSPTSPLNDSCDMSYVSKEHQKFYESLLNQNSSPKRKKNSK